MHTKERICPRISSSVPTPSTKPDSSLWNFADKVSHFEASFPAIAFGAFKNNFPFPSINVKSVIADATASPPPHFPKTAVICGITPDAIACFI